VRCWARRSGRRHLQCGRRVQPALLRVPFEDLDRQLAIHLRAPMRLAHGALPGTFERGRGHVVVVSGLNGCGRRDWPRPRRPRSAPRPSALQRALPTVAERLAVHDLRGLAERRRGHLERLGLRPQHRGHIAGQVRGQDERLNRRVESNLEFLLTSEHLLEHVGGQLHRREQRARRAGAAAHALQQLAVGRQEFSGVGHAAVFVPGPRDSSSSARPTCPGAPAAVRARHGCGPRIEPVERSQSTLRGHGFEAEGAARPRRAAERIAEPLPPRYRLRAGALILQRVRAITPLP